MIRVEINIPRPLITLLMLGGIAGIIYWQHSDAFAMGGQVTASLMPDSGGPLELDTEAVYDSEQEIRRLRTKQSILAHREEILRYQLRSLEEERRKAGTSIRPGLEDELTRSRDMLLSLLKDQKESEKQLLTSLKQMWEAEGRVFELTKDRKGDKSVWLSWPVEPTEGLSAGFEDPDYEEHFGIKHEAIDIPTLQGTVIGAAADGVVEEIADNGYGFNYVILRHGAIATLYGHVEDFLVTVGQEVLRGDPIARSGGMPGTPGAGALSTGPHLHFEVIRDGRRINPLLFLPRDENVEKPRREY